MLSNLCLLGWKILHLSFRFVCKLGEREIAYLPLCKERRSLELDKGT